RLRFGADPGRGRCRADSGHRLGRRGNPAASGGRRARRPCLGRARRLDLPLRRPFRRRGQGSAGRRRRAGAPGRGGTGMSDSKPETPAAGASDWDARILDELYALIESRRGADPGSSYTAKLFAKGEAKIAQKLGEEAVETVIEGIRNDPEAL